MVRSKFLRLNARDFIKGAIYAVLSGVVVFAAKEFQAGPVELNLAFLVLVGKFALSTFIAYVAGNLFQNSKGEFITTEPKKVVKR